MTGSRHLHECLSEAARVRLSVVGGGEVVAGVVADGVVDDEVVDDDRIALGSLTNALTYSAALLLFVFLLSLGAWLFPLQIKVVPLLSLRPTAIAALKGEAARAQGYNLAHELRVAAILVYSHLLFYGFFSVGEGVVVFNIVVVVISVVGIVLLIVHLTISLSMLM